MTASAAIPLYVAGVLSEPATAAVDGLAAGGQRVKRFVSAGALAELADVLIPGCALTELHGDDAPDARLSEALAGAALPLIVLAPSGTAATLIVAVRDGGAFEVMLAPHRIDALAATVAAAARRVASAAIEPLQPAEPNTVLAGLSGREREVLDGLMDGGTNKSIARTLGISPRTVELHRARLMDRLEVRRFSDLLRLALGAPRSE